MLRIEFIPSLPEDPATNAEKILAQSSPSAQRLASETFSIFFNFPASQPINTRK
jgi:hypothetical protein